MAFKLYIKVVNMVGKLVQFCRKNLNLSNYHYAEPYRSLSICILDCVYSLRAQYYRVTVPIVNRYADRFMEGDRHAEGYTLLDFINHIKETGGSHKFAHEILKNNQQLNGRLKSEICYELARKSRLLDIETIEDFQNYKSVEVLEIIIKSVKGIGPAGLNYLFMLAGDSDRCKPDVHIHQCIVDACGNDVTDEDCQKLLTEAVKVLRVEYIDITVRALDSLIWKKYQLSNRQ